jgi:hypothetical protein
VPELKGKGPKFKKRAKSNFWEVIAMNVYFFLWSAQILFYNTDIVSRLKG